MSVAFCMLGLVVVSGIAIDKSHSQFIDLKKEANVTLVKTAIKVVDFYYQRVQSRALEEVEAAG